MQIIEFFNSAEGKVILPFKENRFVLEHKRFNLGISKESLANAESCNRQDYQGESAISAEEPGADFHPPPLGKLRSALSGRNIMCTSF